MSQHSNLDDYGFEPEYVYEPEPTPEPQPPRPPAPSPLPDVALALVALALGCTVGILLRIGLEDTGYLPYHVRLKGSFLGLLPPLACIALVVLVYRSWHFTRPPTLIATLPVATALIAAASVAIGLFAFPGGFPDEMPPWLVESTPKAFHRHLTTAYWTIGLTVSGTLFALGLEHRENAVANGQHPQSAGVITLAITCLLMLPYSVASEAAQDWLGPVGAVYSFSLYLMFGGLFFLAIKIVCDLLGPALPGPTWLRAVTIGAATSAVFLFVWLLFLAAASRRRSTVLDVDDLLDHEDD